MSQIEQMQEWIDHHSKRADRAEALNEGLLEALGECEEYFDQRADADHGNDYVGNAEMDYLMVVRAAIAKATGGTQ